MEYDFKEILDIGLEIEFSNIKRETPFFVTNLQKKLINFKHVHDASTETPELTIGNIPVQFEVNGKTNKLISILHGRNLETLGGEINSPIMASNDFKQHIYKLMDFLIDMGESFSTTEQDNRGSIHVHVNVSKDIKHKHLIRLLELGLAVEAIFYRLGGMGRVNRGVHNSFIYQRPLTLPPCVAFDDRYFPIFYYNDLLESKNKTDFYNKYGDTISQIHNGNHYVTQRYMGLNFYSIPYRGSIEFRYANKVLIPEWIIAWIILCQAFTNYALTKPFDETFEINYRKLEDNRDIPTDEVKNIFNKLEIPEEYQITLLDIWKLSDVPTFDGKQIITHLQNPSFYTGNISYLPRAIENANRIFVQDVRTVNSEKSLKLMNVRVSQPELDYVIDTSGVKSKIKDLGIRENELEINRENYIHGWDLLGFNIEHYTHEDVNQFIQSRIVRNKFIPTSIMSLEADYEFDTKYNNLKIIICINRNQTEINLSFYDSEHGIESRMLTLATERNEILNSYIIDLSPYIEDCHRHPNNYFNEEDNENNDEQNVEENVEENVEVQENNLNYNDFRYIDGLDAPVIIYNNWRPNNNQNPEIRR